MEVVASLSQGRTAAAQCGLFTFKSVPAIFEPPCSLVVVNFISTGIVETIILHGIVNEVLPYFVNFSFDMV